MLDYLAIFKGFNDAGIKYLVVGGLAVNLYGVPRMTYDVDLLLDLEDDNVNRFVGLMQEWGFKPKVPVAITEFSEKEKREDWIKNKHMKAFNLVNPEWAIKEIDVIIDSPVDYTLGAQHARTMVLQGVPIPIVSIDDLIKMKAITDRQQDAADIRYLRELQHG